MTIQRSAGVALLLIFLAAHLALLPRTLEDLDSINFALGVRDFDVARHQPHPPGYPVFIGLAKLSTWLLRSAGVDAAAPRGLAVWSALAATAALPALFLFFRRLEGRSRLAWCATLVVATSPLFWFSGLRPLSDMLGFATAMWVLALVTGTPTPRAMAIAAILAGLAVGIRLQAGLLAIPALLLALAPVGVRSLKSAATIGAGFAAGVLLWAVPLLVASGGPGAYLQALGAQAGEDFSGVVMLWTHRTARVAANALVNSFVWPWDWWVGVAICVLAAIGAARLAWRTPRALALAVAAFAPYAVFHLLFQETETTRYALPLLPLVAYAAMAALEGLPANPLAAAAIGIAAISLTQVVPASLAYAREGAPVFRAFEDMAATAHGGNRVDTIAVHAGARRAAEWATSILPARVAKAPHGREWLTLVALWQAEPRARVWFAADPGRTDLALFDERSRQLSRGYRWGFVEPPYVGGVRPDEVDWYDMQPPGWMLDRGWAVTAEVGGITARDKLGPAVAPSIAWLKRQPNETAIVLGGRLIAGERATLDVTVNGAPVGSYPLTPGPFFKLVTLPAGALNASTAYVPLEVKAGPSSVSVSLEQFDAQPPGVPMFGYDTGWQEPEFNPATGRSWRWTSEKSSVWVRPIGRDVILRLVGESPLRYFDAAPQVRVLVAGQEVSTFDPADDFEQIVTLPAALLERANGPVTLESSKFFVPAAAGAQDQRHLALRIYRLSVE